MNSLSELLKTLENDEHIERYKSLEKLIDQNSELKNDYKKLLDLQKVLVKAQTLKTAHIHEAEQAYNDQKEKLMSNILIEEYLDLIELINNDLQLIKDIIETEINKDLTSL